ncbi:MAG: carboxypeptidase regulatory-like domain-containing protein, partial [Bacteroidales bacterium]|nr:carboxypeptidase regulatory-like domain-containing protein [Bacteroidales bacterium]
MNRIIFCLIIAASLISQHTKAQVVSLDMLTRNANTDVKLTLKDAKSSDPISWASVYLIPDGDTTITHFALSDERGDVLLKDVPVGKYELNAEMMGYNPHRKVYTIKPHWDAFDLGIIRMEENAEFLDAAAVSAVGNPIVVKKDTIEFNAASFKVGENAMLEDLLKKMPGMEVSDDGTVTLNGEQIDKITVGGKTFFFNEPNAALKNLPAKIVDKIKVIDKTKDEAAA